MTISAIAQTQTYSANGSQTEFNFPYRFDAASNLVVTKEDSLGVITTLVMGVNYTVQGVGADTGGSITTLGTPIPLGYKVHIARRVPFTQPVDLRNQGAYLPEIIEKEFDRLTMEVQDLRDIEVGDTAALQNQITTLQVNDTLLFGNDLIGYSLTPDVGKGSIFYHEINDSNPITFNNPIRTVNGNQVPVLRGTRFTLEIYNASFDHVTIPTITWGNLYLQGLGAGVRPIRAPGGAQDGIDGHGGDALVVTFIWDGNYWVAMAREENTLDVLTWAPDVILSPTHHATTDLRLGSIFYVQVDNGNDILMDNAGPTPFHNGMRVTYDFYNAYNNVNPPRIVWGSNFYLTKPFYTPRYASESQITFIGAQSGLAEISRAEAPSHQTRLATAATVTIDLTLGTFFRIACDQTTCLLKNPTGTVPDGTIITFLCQSSTALLDCTVSFDTKLHADGPMVVKAQKGRTIQFIYNAVDNFWIELGRLTSAVVTS